MVRPGMLFRHDQQCQPETVENGKRLVEPYAALAIFKTRHQIDRHTK